MQEKQCAQCEKPLIGKQKRCCSKECKNLWFAEQARRTTKTWTPEFERAYMKEYRAKNKEKIKELLQSWTSKNRERVNEMNRWERERLKTDILNHYSGGKMCCANCGFSDTRALQVDHIENNGAEERRELFGNRLFAGNRFYRWVRRNNYPTGYAILCANCNIIKLREFEKQKCLSK